MIGYNESAAVAVTAAGSALAVRRLSLTARFNKVNYRRGLHRRLSAGQRRRWRHGRRAGQLPPTRCRSIRLPLLAPSLAAPPARLSRWRVTNEKTKQAMFICWGNDVWTRVISG